MNNLNLFTDVNNRYVALENNDFICSRCENKIKDFFFLNINWNRKKKSEMNFYCNMCVGNVDVFAEVSEFKVVMLVDKIISGLTPVIIDSPQLVDSKNNMTTFDAVGLPAPRVVDRTKYAGRESFEGALIGANIHDLIEEKDKPLELSEFDSMFAELEKDAVKEIEYKEDKQ